MKLDKRAGERQIDIRIQAGQTAPSQKKRRRKRKKLIFHVRRARWRPKTSRA
jgi:hypothetical protein